MFGKFYILVLASICSIVLRIQGFHSISISLLLALIYLLYKHKKNNALVLSSVITFAFFQLNPYYIVQPPQTVPTPNKISGQITSIPKFSGNKVTFEFKTTQSNTVQVQYFAKTKKELDDLKKLKYGYQCFLEGVYQEPPTARNFYSFDYKSYLATKNIFFQFIPKAFSASNCHDVRLSPYSAMQRYRQLGIEYLKDHFPEESKGIITALIFGARGEMDNETLQAYQALGIVHLLAVSGLHVGLVSVSLYFLCIRIGITKERANDLLLVLLPIYVVIAGGAPSVIRAAAMAMIVLISLRFRLKINPLDGISFIFLGFVLINPEFLLHIGFQLSFLVSYSLIISARSILQKYSSWFSQLAAVTILAQFVSFPVIIYNFYEISIWSIPLNLIYIPFITFFALPLAFFIFISHLIFQPISEVLLLIYELIIEIAHLTLLKTFKLPYSTLLFGKPPLYIIVLYYIAIGYLFFVWEKTKSMKVLLKTGIPFFLVATLHWNLPYITNQGEVTMLDVGQGDSIYIELPKRKAIYLIDTGGSAKLETTANWRSGEKEFDVGESILLPFLKAKGVREIDKLILTHGHMDHIGGAEALIGKINVKTLLYGAGPIEEEFEVLLLKKFAQANTEIKYVTKGDSWRIGDTEFHLLAPQGGETNANNRSIVLLTRLGGLNWLFTGDIEVEGEIALLHRYQKLPVDVLKVAHHGSKTSTTDKLLTAITPKYALIPVGVKNRFGHPHQEVINRLNKHNVLIYRTDRHGAIRYTFKKDSGSFETVIENKKRKSPKFMNF